MEENKLATIMDYLKAYTTISRYEYWPGIAPGLFVALLLGINSLWDIVSPYTIETIILCVLLYFSGFVINSLADYDLDQKYGTYKSAIPRAVDTIGKTKVRLILGFQVTTALLLSIHLTFALDNIWLLILAGLGILFGLGYSAKPLYFKVKGIWHAVSLGASAFFIPLIFIYMVVADTVTFLGILLIFGVTIAHYSVAMANQAADHLEDKREGVLTPTVRLGLERTLKWSMISTTFGMLFIMAVIGLIYMTSDSTSALTSGLDGSGIPPMALILPFMSVIIALGYYVPIRGLRDLHRLASEAIPLEERMERIKNRIHYVKWQSSGIFGVAMTLTILFIAGLNPSIVNDDDGAVTGEITGLDVNSLKISDVVINTETDVKTPGFSNVIVSLSTDNIEDPKQLTDVQVFVDAGTATSIFDTGYSYVDPDGQASVRIDLQGTNESEVWYSVYLVHDGERSSQTWSEPSASDLYIFNADLIVEDEGLVHDSVQLTISTFNSGRVREPDSITLKIEWAPLLVDWLSNNATVNPHQVWETTIDREILKDYMSGSSTLKIYLYYDDEQFDEMKIEF